eukprot:CAMPEP_0202894648 /NCGR_PEP_ID=MMETSP1392-20130828/4006_1 /ASSEMBLY_ACC=CAM_ASM_000868 /TAXON_ID=225041 /ORGANISM="Chlamydomonas chlamydogama, Strain SAG 11-48b" /LENGTH=274 /DNA_ID=CAMNT_0049579399 /DNA_START=174 /DNA_END=998 /DNA_ORIENTATION=+
MKPSSRCFTTRRVQTCSRTVRASFQARTVIVTKAQPASSTTGTAAGTSAGRPRTKDDLNDPAQIGATGTASTTVQDFGGDVSLSTYMMLPVEQYFVLDPNQIRFLQGTRFLLKVPRVEILNVWLEPEVEINVVSQAEPPRVVLQAENCRIRGSDLIENMRLDQKFCLRFTTELTWRSSKALPGDSVSSMSSYEGDMMGQGEIVGNAQLDVWSEVIPPFNLMPRELLQSSCNVVMRGLVSTLLPLFVRKLGEDYEKWAVDPAYRAQRSTRKMPLS